MKIILFRWKKNFAWLPVETLIKENQAEYYKALSASDTNADSTVFTEFMLSLLASVIEESIENSKKITVKITQKITVNQEKILSVLKKNPFATQEELSQIVGIARLNINKNMKKLQEQGIIKRIGSDKSGHWEILQ